MSLLEEWTSSVLPRLAHHMTAYPGVKIAAAALSGNRKSVLQQCGFTPVATLLLREADANAMWEFNCNYYQYSDRPARVPALCPRHSHTDQSDKLDARKAIKLRHWQCRRPGHNTVGNLIIPRTVNRATAGGVHRKTRNRSRPPAGGPLAGHLQLTDNYAAGEYFMNPTQHAS